MERLYIINSETFFRNGDVLNTMDCKNPFDPEEINTSFVHYCENKTFAEYNREHQNKLIALNWNDFSKSYYSKYLSSLQGEFEEIDEKRYYYLLEVLPPKKWHQIKDITVFYVGECYTADLYTLCIRYKDKFFSALRSINLSDIEVYNHFTDSIKKK